MKKPMESSAEEMMDTMPETDESPTEDSTWLQDFVDHLSPEEITQLKTLLSNTGDNTNEANKGSPPSYEAFKKVAGA